MRNICDTGLDARLNLGCGDDVRRGYLNIDFRQTHPSVIQVDLSVHPWPFADRSAKEILMLDFLEHLPYAKTPFILLECFRTLQDDGEVVIQVPDARHLAMALTGDGPFLCNRCGESMHDRETSRDANEFVAHSECPGCKQGKEEIADAAMRRLYGGQDHQGNFHHTCFTPEQLTYLTSRAGLKLIGEEEHDHQYKKWNFKMRFGKGSVW
jgi:hypothetical protein